MPINIRLSKTAKESLDWLKTNYDFTSFSDCVTTMGTFFKSNAVSPRETVSKNFSESLFNLKNEIIFKLEEIKKQEHDNIERVIKINRRIEEDLIKPIKKNVYEIHGVVIEKHNSRANELLMKNAIDDDTKILIESSSLDKIKELEKVIYQQDINTKKNRFIIEEQDKKMNEYHRCLRILNEKVGYVDNIMGKKVFIDLPFDDVQALFYLIP